MVIRGFVLCDESWGCFVVRDYSSDSSWPPVFILLKMESSTRLVRTPNVVQAPSFEHRCLRRLARRITIRGSWLLD